MGLSEEHKRKIAKAVSAAWTPERRKAQAEITRRVHTGKKRSKETRDRLSEANRRRTPEQKKAATSKANEKVRALAASGLWHPAKGKRHHNNTKDKSAAMRLAAEARRGLNNPVYKVIDGQTHADRCRLTRKRNGTTMKGRANPAYGKVYGSGIRRCWRFLPSGFLVSYRSTWESAFAGYLEALGVAYNYEPKTFYFDGFTYTPDFYLPEIDLWIEVKGYLREDDEQKVEALRSNGYNLLLIDANAFKLLELAAFKATAIDIDSRLRSNVRRIRRTDTLCRTEPIVVFKR